MGVGKVWQRTLATAAGRVFTKNAKSYFYFELTTEFLSNAVFDTAHSHARIDVGITVVVTGTPPSLGAH